MELSLTNQKTLSDLQKPTFELISSFYEMPKEVEDTFINLLAYYEQNPSENTTKIISDKISSRETKEEKILWAKTLSKDIPLQDIETVRKKYMEANNSVPKGMPTSGQLLSFLDIIPRNIKDALLECQASARIIQILEKPEQVDIKKETSITFTDGKANFSRPHLDKPFATNIQRFEHIATLLAGKKPFLDDAGIEFLDKLRLNAIQTLNQSANIIEKHNPEAGKRIHQLASAYGISSEKLNVKDNIQMLNKVLSDGKLADISPLLTHRMNQIASNEIKENYLHKAQYLR